MRKCSFALRLRENVHRRRRYLQLWRRFAVSLLELLSTISESNQFASTPVEISSGRNAAQLVKTLFEMEFRRFLCPFALFQSAERLAFSPSTSFSSSSIRSNRTRSTNSSVTVSRDDQSVRLGIVEKFSFRRLERSSSIR